MKEELDRFLERAELRLGRKGSDYHAGSWAAESLQLRVEIMDALDDLVDVLKKGA